MARETQQLIERDPNSLIPDPNNAKIHNQANVALIAGSIKKFGFRAPVLIDGDGGIIAGHGRVLAALKLGLETVPCVDCSDMSEADRRAYMIADNKIAEDSPWDDEVLQAELAALTDLDFDLSTLGFDDDELKALIAGEGGGGGGDSPYTKKIQSPIYEPRGEKPAIGDLCDATNAETLLAEIEAADLPDDVASFLRQAAARHTAFNFAKIADFYAHSSAEIQRLMERSALVVIDYDQAIELGFVKLLGAVDEEYAAAINAD